MTTLYKWMLGVENIEQASAEGNTESRLLESIRSFLFGRTEAFEYIYNSTFQELMAVCRRYASSRDDAEDILQESYIKIYKNLGKFDTSAPFGGWAKRIVINTAIDHYRRNLSKTFRSIDNFDIEDEEEVFVSNKLLETDIDKVLQAIQELPDGYRIILNLYVLERKTHKEIAELLSISESTSRSQLTKARKTLKARFENESR